MTERSSELLQKVLDKLHPITKTNFVEPGGTQIRVGTGSDADDAYNSTHLISAFYDAAAALDEKGVSGEGRVAVLNPRQYYELIQERRVQTVLINSNERGTALQSGQGIIEIAGITIYKSMNIPFFGNYGTKYGTSSASANPGATDPGNTGSFVEEATEDARASVTGINNNYGNSNDFANTLWTYLPKRSCWCCRSYRPTSSGNKWRRFSCIPR